MRSTLLDRTILESNVRRYFGDIGTGQKKFLLFTYANFLVLFLQLFCRRFWLYAYTLLGARWGAHTCSLSIQERGGWSAVQGHFQVHSKWEPSLGIPGSVSKINTNNSKKKKKKKTMALGIKPKTSRGKSRVLLLSRTPSLQQFSLLKEPFHNYTIQNSRC